MTEEAENQAEPPKPYRSFWSRLDFRHPGAAAVVGLAVAVAGVLLVVSHAATPTPLVGIDIYNGQPYVNGSLAKSQGGTFVISKVSQGDWFTDFRFPGNRHNTTSAGMIAGGYHFLERGNPIQQAKFFVNDIKKGGSTKGVMFMVDVETYPSCSGGVCGTKWPSYFDVTQFVQEFHKLVPNRKLILYTGKWFWGSRLQHGFLGNPKAPPGTVLDVSIYVNEGGPLWQVLKNVGPQGTAGDPYPGDAINGYPSYEIRQFTASASFANEDPVDGDVTYKGLAELKRLAGIGVDTTAPKVSISSPANNATVKGTTTITAKASDNVKVTKVEFFLDGQWKKTDTASPYTWNWATPKYSPGTHTIMARAFDAAGNKSSTKITLKSLDQSQPQVSISSPANNAAVHGTVTIKATATDNVGIAKVNFKIDGMPLGTDTTATYSAKWDTGKAACGAHTATATAFDKAGNTATSAAVQLFVYQPADLNHDCQVNIVDLSKLLANWGKTGKGLVGDINGDGKVDVVDLSLLLSKWGT